MFKLNDKVVYPAYGAGKIVKIYKEEIAGKKVKYFKIKLVENPIEISIPVDKAETLKLRKPMSNKDLKKAMKTLNKAEKVSEEDMQDLDTIVKDLLKSGKFVDTLKVARMMKTIEKKKKEAKASLNTLETRSYQMSMNFIRAEVMLVLGKKYVKDYGLALE